MEQFIILFYIFFEGLLIFQFCIFLYLFIISGKKELVCYGLFLLLLAANFLISDPSTFGLGSNEVVLNSDWYKFINTPLVIVANLFYVLFLKHFYRTLTTYKLFFAIINAVRITLLGLIVLFYVLLALGIHSNFLFDIINIVLTLVGVWLLVLIIKNKMPFTRLMAMGFLANLVGTLSSAVMLSLLANGVEHLLVSEYPFVFIKLGLLIEIFFFNLAIFKKWQRQEQELSLQKIQSELAMEKIKGQISKELHDDIGANLSGIQMYSQMALQQAGQGNFESSGKSIKVIENATGDVLNHLKDMVWSIQPGNDKLEDLFEKIQEYAVFITGAKNIRLHWHAPEIIPQQTIATEARHNIYMIVKEALNNAVKYAAAENIHLNILLNSGSVSIAIKNDGKGFDAGKEYAGHGLKNMYKRAAEINGELKISSSPLEGTSLVLLVKITQ